jgi:hypothetical protein
LFIIALALKSSLGGKIVSDMLSPILNLIGYYFFGKLKTTIILNS